MILVYKGLGNEELKLIPKWKYLEITISEEGTGRAILSGNEIINKSKQSK